MPPHSSTGASSGSRPWMMSHTKVPMTPSRRGFFVSDEMSLDDLACLRTNCCSRGLNARGARRAESDLPSCGSNEYKLIEGTHENRVLRGSSEALRRTLRTG